MARIGSCWAQPSWADPDWAVGTWANAVVVVTPPSTAAGGGAPGKTRRRRIRRVEVPLETELPTVLPQSSEPDRAARAAMQRLRDAERATNERIAAERAALVAIATTARQSETRRLERMAERQGFQVVQDAIRAADELAKQLALADEESELEMLLLLIHDL